MTTDTDANNPSSSGNGNGDGTTGTVATQKIREFLYLNQNKIFSYLSQIDGGLKLLYLKVKEEGWQEMVGKPEETTDVKLGASGTIEAKIALLAGMTGEVSGEWNHSVKSGVDLRADSERSITSDLFGLHHKAFDLVMSNLGSRLETKTGQICIIDFEWLMYRIRDFPEIAKSINVFATSDQRVNSPNNTKQMFHLFQTYMKDKILIILKEDDGNIVTSYLSSEHCTSAISTIITDYSSNPTLRFSLVGISAPPQRALNAGSFAVPHFQPDGQGIADQLAVFAAALSGMREFFEVKSTQGHLVPLALYLEI